MPNIKPPDGLVPSNTNVTDLKLWLEAFEDYMLISYPKADDKQKRSLFLAIGGMQLRRVVNRLTLDDEKFDTLLDAVCKYFQPVKSVVIERYKFFGMVREVEEELASFLVRLKTQATVCDFDNTAKETMTNQLIRDQYVRCCNDAKITERLLSEKALTLTSAVETAEAIHQATKDARSMASSSKTLLPMVHKKEANKSDVRRRADIVCHTCQKKGHYSRDCYRNHKCENCGIIGHTKEVCRQNAKKDDKNSKNGQSRPRNPKPFLVVHTPTESAKLHYVTVNFLNVSGRFLVDTGAAFSTISKDFVHRYFLSNHLVPCSLNIIVGDGRNVTVSQCIKCSISVQDKSFHVTLYILDNHVDGVLGMDILPTVGLRLGPDSGLIFSLVSDVLHEYQDIFDKPLKDSVLTGIDPFPIVRLNADAIPKRAVARPFNKPHQEFLKTQVTDLLDSGVIAESHSPWRHNPVIVPKSDGRLRLAINYKPVNAETVMDAYPTPIIDDLLRRLAGATVFSCIDFSQFYHQLPLVKEDQEKTAFQACGKLFHYVRCPFGLRNAVAYCSRIMAKVFAGIPNVLVYLDDVMIFGSDRHAHDNALQQILLRVRQHNLSLNMRKCQFYKTSIRYLGHVVENGTVKPDPDRVAPVLNFPLPTSAKALQSFLGLATYYSKYVPHYSDISRPLYDKVANFDEWVPSEQAHFERLKKAVSEAILVIPQPNEKLRLRTDASNDAVSGILETVDGRPVYFCSRVLQSSEKRLDIVEKEALAIHWSVTRLRSFLVGRHFEILSDHRPLQFIFNNDRCSAKVLRWRMELQEFSFEVVHCRGVDNVAADCLSRMYTLDVNTVVFLSDSEVSDAQSFDTETKQMVEALTKSFVQKPKNVSDQLWRVRNQLEIRDNILCTTGGKYFVPFSLRRKVLTVAHGCHHGEKGTLERLRSKFFWPGVTEAVSGFVKKCRTCSLVRPKFTDPTASPMLTKCPMEVLACDFTELPSSSGFRYLLVIIDVFSRYPMAFPLRDMTTKSVIEKFSEVFSQFGFPDAILSDQGSQFESREFLQFLEKFHIKKLRTNAYHPAGNGLCERFNGTLKRSLLSYVTERGLPTSCWTRGLNHCLLDNRTTPHFSTKLRPVDLFLSFSARGFLPAAQGDAQSAVDTNLASQVKSKQYCDRKAVNREFPVGSTVLVKNDRFPKFSVKGTLAEVLEQISNHTVVLRALENGRTFRCAVNRVSQVNTKSFFSDLSSSPTEPTYTQYDTHYPQSATSHDQPEGQRCVEHTTLPSHNAPLDDEDDSNIMDNSKSSDERAQSDLDESAQIDSDESEQSGSDESTRSGSDESTQSGSKDENTAGGSRDDADEDDESFEDADDGGGEDDDWQPPRGADQAVGVVPQINDQQNVHAAIPCVRRSRGPPDFYGERRFF